MFPRLVRETVAGPSRICRRDDQLLALEPLNQEYALGVVYKIVTDNSRGYLQFP